MIEGGVASHLRETLRLHWRMLLAVMPGLMASALHSTMLQVPRAEFIDALDSDHYRIQWITGSYLIGSAAGMALTSFLGGRLGLRLAYLVGVAGFTLAGTACALVVETVTMAPLRLVQGLGNGLILSVGMVLIWRAMPVHRAFAMALYGMAIDVPTIAGATLGGWLTAWASWRLIFLFCLPLGGIAGLLAWRLLPPDRPRNESPPHFDGIGLALLLAWLITMSVVLDMGQYWGWLTSPSFVPWFVGFALALAAFVLWGTLSPGPLINLRPLARRNFALGLAIKAILTINLLVMMSVLAGAMVNLRGYQWTQASLVIAPAIVTMTSTILVGIRWGTRQNRKLRMAAGLAVMAYATAAFAAFDLYTAKGSMALVMAVWGAGAGFVIGPSLLTAFEGMSSEETLRTAGVFNILRTLPAFIVGSVLTIATTRNTDAQFDVLRQTIRWNRPIVAEAFRRPESHFVEQGSPGDAAGKQAHAALAKWVHANSRAFALQELFRVLACVPAFGVALVLFVRVVGEGNDDGQGTA